VIQEEKLKEEQMCISVAWDWMFRGASATGINREISSVIEATILNRKQGKVSLAIPELSLLRMARMYPTSEVDLPAEMSFCQFISGSGSGSDDDPKPFEPSKTEVCLGILPALRHVVGQHVSSMEMASQTKSKSTARGERVTIAKRPNTAENPQAYPVDPYGNSDFMCKLCSKELSNVYFHCDGCEQLLSKDFNICQKCHSEKKFMMVVQMHPMNNKRHSTINHTGTFVRVLLRWNASILVVVSNKTNMRKTLYH
jgi:hypothetical protein